MSPARARSWREVKRGIPFPTWVWVPFFIALILFIIGDTSFEGIEAAWRGSVSP